MGAPAATAVSVRDVTFEDVAVLKHALDFELDILTEKSDVRVALLIGLNGQVLASAVPHGLSSDLYRLLSMVRAKIPLMQTDMSLSGLQQSIERYESGNVIVSRVGRGELLISVLEKTASVTKNLPQIFTSAQVLSHISSQQAITEQELASYGPEVAQELADLTKRLYAALEGQGTVGERKINEEILARFRAILEKVVGKAEADMTMVTAQNQLGVRPREILPSQWEELIARISSAVELKAGRYYAEMCQAQLNETFTEAKKLF